MDRPALAPQQVLADALGADARLRRGDGGGIEQDLVGHSHLLESGGGRHGIAGERDGPRAGHLPNGGHDLAGGDSDAKLHRLIPAGRVPRQGGLHLESAQAGSQRVVVMRPGHAEDRQHGVADELLERTPEVDDRLAEGHQGAVDAGPDLFRIQLVDEARVADEVGEERRDYPPIARLQTLGERVETSAALVAEAGAGGSGRSAVGTGHRDLPGATEWYATVEPARSRKSTPGAQVGRLWTAMRRSRPAALAPPGC